MRIDRLPQVCWSLASALMLVSLAAAAFAQDPTGEQPETPTLPETEVIAPEEPDEGFAGDDDALPSILEGTIFSSPEAFGYSADSSTSGTIIDVPNLELPATVDVVTEQVIEDQQAIRFDDVIRDIPGAVKVVDQLRPDSVFIRGFEIRSRDMRKNNFRDPSFSPRDLANVQRIEVLKGPSSVIWGAGQPAGMINFITKKPLTYRYDDLQAQFGSYGLQRYTVDSSGPVDPDGTTLYRFIAALEDSSSFRDFGFKEHYFIAPSVTWVLDDTSKLTWEGEFLRDRRRFDTGVVAVDGDPKALPQSRFLGEPANDFQKFNDWRSSIFYEKEINDCWTLRFGAYSLFYSAPSSGTVPFEFISPTEVNRNRQDFTEFEEQYHSIIVNLAGEFWTGGIEHQAVIGAELGWFLSDPSVALFSGLMPQPIDIFNPAYTNPTFLLDSDFISRFSQNGQGLYVQDFMRIDDHWTVLAGVRYDNVDVDFSRSSGIFGIPLVIPPTQDIQNFNRWSPRAGIVYEAIPDVLSFYGNYARSFSPPGGNARATTERLRPELGESVEGGVKTVVLPCLTLTAAGYHIVKKNITVDEFDGSMFVTRQVGQQTSKGAEVSLAGQITDQWSVLANYAYTDTKLSDSVDPAIDGERARGVPYNSASVWTRYNFIDCCDETFGAAIGYVYVGDRTANLQGTARLLSYSRWDAGLYFKRGRLSASLYAENLFDVGYLAGSVDEFQIAPGAPFTIRGQLGWTY